MKQKKRSCTYAVLISALLLVLPIGGNLFAQDIKPAGVNLLIYGGTSFSLGGGFQNTGSAGINVMQPEAGVKVSMNLAGRFRAGIGAGYTSMVREQFNGTLEPITGDGFLAGSCEGTMYRDLKTHFCIADLIGEFGLLKPGGPVQMFIGTGAGCLFATGNTWSLSLRNEMRSDEWTNKVTINGHNEGHDYTAPFIPASLSLECRILPGTSLCLGGVYRLIISNNEFAPKGQAMASLGLRLAF